MTNDLSTGLMYTQFGKSIHCVGQLYRTPGQGLGSVQMSEHVCIMDVGHCDRHVASIQLAGVVDHWSRLVICVTQCSHTCVTTC